MSEPKLVKVVERVTADPDWIDLECTFSDGQKYTAIQVDVNFPLLAKKIVYLLEDHIKWNNPL